MHPTLQTQCTIYYSLISYGRDCSFLKVCTLAEKMLMRCMFRLGLQYTRHAATLQTLEESLILTNLLCMAVQAPKLRVTALQ